MEKELSYLSPEGFTVFTSKFHKNRGTCCKSACLHCPYGYTIKKHGIQFQNVSERDEELVSEILNENKQPDFDWRAALPDNVLLMKLKGTVAGIVIKNHIVVKHVFLRDHFKDQDLSKELIESYIFI